jgi:hypothetical protein
MLAPGTTVDLKSLAKSPEMKPFVSGAKRIEKMISAIEAGGDITGDWSKENYAVMQAINKLDSKSNKAEIRGDESLREQADALVSSLRARRRQAEEVGFEARQSLRHAEIRGLREKEYTRVQSAFRRSTRLTVRARCMDRITASSRSARAEVDRVQTALGSPTLLREHGRRCAPRWSAKLAHGHVERPGPLAVDRSMKVRGK